MRSPEETPIAQKQRSRWLTPKRIVVVFLLCGLATLYVFCALGAVAIGEFSARESGGIHGINLVFTAVVGGAIFTVVALTVPRTAFGGAFEFGDYAAQQPWILFGVCLAVAVVLAGLRARPSTWGVTLAAAYALALLTTNYAANWFRVDHSHDFPIARAINSLDWRDQPTEADVLARAGQPLARGEFDAGDPVLPGSVSENMLHWKTPKALILAYYEAESFGRVSTHYVILDPITKRVISRVSINEPIPDKWPHQVIRRTPKALILFAAPQLAPFGVADLESCWT